MSVIDQQTRYQKNRENFAQEIAARTRTGQRNGLFSQPMSLTIGDSSTNYQKERRPAKEIGKLRNFSNNRGNLITAEPFNKLTSNAIGDEFIDPGKYFLRSESGKKQISVLSFKPSGGHKLVKNSEFVHLKEYNEHKAGPKNIPINFLARSTTENFQKQFIYSEDAYERKEDMRKLDYQRRAALILDKTKPYTTTVFQHGTFDPFRKTYANQGGFISQAQRKPDPPSFGPFRIGNLSKQGYNKSIGPNLKYYEDPIEDTVTYQKDVKKPIWKDPTNVQSTPYNPMSTTYTNTMGRLNK